MRRRLLTAMAVFFIPVAGVQASGVAPYLPINMSPILENEIERLAVIAGISNLTKPYNVATIFDALSRIQDSHPRLHARIEQSLERYSNTLAITHAKIEGAYSKEKVSIPNARGTTTDTNAKIDLRLQLQAADWLGFYLGAEAIGGSNDPREGEEVRPTGSILSLGVDWAQLDIGYRDYWLSPFQGSAQLLSTNAETMPSISLSNNRQIEFFGLGFNYQVFVAEMGRQNVLFNEQLSDRKKPLLSGFHLSVSPVSWWSFGATRMFQFGGGERPTKLKTLARAFVDPSGADNNASVDEESGNQIAAFSSRMHFDGAVPFSLSAELAGEDTGNGKKEQLGNTSLTVGLYIPYFFTETLSFTYEYADWQQGWYINNVYSEGYSTNGFVNGHWAAQVPLEREPPHPEGRRFRGHSHYMKVQWQTPSDHILSAVVRSSSHEDTTNVDYERGWQVDLDYSIPLREHILSAGLFAGEDNFGEDFWQLKVGMQWN